MFGPVAEAIEAYLPAIEIVDHRFTDWQTRSASPEPDAGALL
jgi:2-keto-4-pentenoate hydratase